MVRASHCIKVTPTSHMFPSSPLRHGWLIFENLSRSIFLKVSRYRGFVQPYRNILTHELSQAVVISVTYVIPGSCCFTSIVNTMAIGIQQNINIVNIITRPKTLLFRSFCFLLCLSFHCLYISSINIQINRCDRDAGSCLSLE